MSVEYFFREPQHIGSPVVMSSPFFFCTMSMLMFIYALNAVEMTKVTARAIDTSDGLLYFLRAFPIKYIPNMTPVPQKMAIQSVKGILTLPKIKNKVVEANDEYMIIYILVDAAIGGETPRPIATGLKMNPPPSPNAFPKKDPTKDIASTYHVMLPFIRRHDLLSPTLNFVFNSYSC